MSASPAFSISPMPSRSRSHRRTSTVLSELKRKKKWCGCSGCSLASRQRPPGLRLCLIFATIFLVSCWWSPVISIWRAVRLGMRSPFGFAQPRIWKNALPEGVTSSIYSRATDSIDLILYGSPGLFFCPPLACMLYYFV